jgi:type I restriction enzyme, S subunit
MKPYPEYKKTNIEWIGDIPEHWEVKKLGYISRIGSGTTPKAGNERYYKDGDMNWLITGDLKTQYIEKTSKKITRTALTEYPSLKLYKPNSLVIAMYGATIGAISILKTETTVNQACGVITLKENYNFLYLYYTLLSNKNNLINDSVGGGQPNVSQDILKKQKLPIPPKSEQTVIATYLYHKTSLIDDLIAKNEKMIELLEEKRKATINQAVTKGLNPNVKFKRTGIEWIDGDPSSSDGLRRAGIPEHWEVKKGKYLFEILSGSATDLTGSTTGEIDFFKVDDLNNTENNLNLKRAKYKIKENQNYFDGIAILFPKRGAAIMTNKLCIVDSKFQIDSNLMGIKLIEKLAVRYIAFQIKNRGLKDIGDISTIPQINNKHIKPLEFIVPPFSEQCLIAKYIDMVTEKIDLLTTKIRTQNELLVEYRKSLISNVVTGKVCVTPLVT